MSCWERFSTPIKKFNAAWHVGARMKTLIFGEMLCRGHDNVHDDMNMYVIMHDQCLFIAMINSFHT